MFNCIFISNSITSFRNLFSITNEPFLFSSQNHIDENNFNPYHLKFKNNFKNDFYIKTSVNSVLSNKLPNNILNLGFLNRFDDLSAYILAQVGYGDISMFELGSIILEMALWAGLIEHS